MRRHIDHWFFQPTQRQTDENSECDTFSLILIETRLHRKCPQFGYGDGEITM